MPPDYMNGSYLVDQGIRLSCQGKFEMLQSSIYPEAYNVPCEYFFIIQIQFEPNEDMDADILLKRIKLKIKDRTKNANTLQIEEIDVDINRPLPNKVSNTGKKTDGVTLKRGGQKVHHNILLYVENLGAKVNGVIEYTKYDDKGNPGDKVFKLEVKPFHLDLVDGQELIKNHNFKEFWKFYAEYEQRVLNNDIAAGANI